ncbi:flagellar hook-length control protein FliK [Bacillus sp. NPDC094064]|uniref:flagellar hook-length control protein FliK n=1 Tax=Bacillus sp. NPDC094064 TaxID=3390549 RepID=UPI003D08BB72
MLQFVLPVQQSLPPQEEKSLEMQPKREESAFDQTMRSENKTRPKTEKAKQEEAPEEKKEYLLVQKPVKKEEPLIKKEEKKETEQILLAISEQMVAIEQLRVQTKLLYQYIQKIQELYKEHGNIKLNELPAAELQQLQELLSNMRITNAICLEDTLQMVLDKVMMPEQTMQVLRVVESEFCNIAKKQEESKDLDADLPKLESDDVKIELPEVDALNDSSSAGVELLNKVTSTDQIGKSNGGAEKVALPDLGKKMEAQVEALQKFVVKQERVLFQLNPEKLGTLTVFMKKHGDQIDVHVEMEKHDAKKRVEIIFDELRLKLKEKEINIQISYSDKDENRKEQREQEQRQKQKLASPKQENQQSKEFAGLLEE